MLCKECNKEFVPKNSKEKICSDECRKARESKYNKKQFENGKRNTLKRNYSLILEDIRNKVKYKDIKNKYNCSMVTVIRIAKENEIYRLRKDNTDIIDFLGLTFSRTMTSTSNRKEKMYIAKCLCGSEKEIPSHFAIRLYKMNKRYECKECSKSKPVRFIRASTQKKRKDNMSGYIGVFVKQYKNKIIGYMSIINSKGLVIFKNKYKDETLNKKLSFKGQLIEKYL